MCGTSRAMCFLRNVLDIRSHPIAHSLRSDNINFVTSASSVGNRTKDCEVLLVPLLGDNGDRFTIFSARFLPISVKKLLTSLTDYFGVGEIDSSSEAVSLFFTLPVMPFIAVQSCFGFFPASLISFLSCSVFECFNNLLQ